MTVQIIRVSVASRIPFDRYDADKEENCPWETDFSCTKKRLARQSEAPECREVKLQDGN